MRYLIVGEGALIVLAVVLKVMLTRRSKKRDEMYGEPRYDYAFFGFDR
jgi:hypothetical protein